MLKSILGRVTGGGRRRSAGGTAGPGGPGGSAGKGSPEQEIQRGAKTLFRGLKRRR